MWCSDAARRRQSRGHDLIYGALDGSFGLQPNKATYFTPALDKDERRNALHAVVHHAAGVFVGVELGEGHPATVFLGQLLDSRRNRATRPAPGCPEVHHHRLR